MLIEIVRGPLEGVTGRLVRHARQYRVVLSITLIQQSIAVEVDARMLFHLDALVV